MKAIRKEDGTWCMVDDDSDILQHYGVKGMKWRHHKRTYVFDGPSIRSAKKLGNQVLGMFKTKIVTDSMKRTGAQILGMFNKNRKTKEYIRKRGTIAKDGTRYTSYSSLTSFR